MEIVESQIKHSLLHPKTKNGLVWVLEFYIHIDVKGKFDAERLENAKGAGMQGKIVHQAFVHKDHTSSIITVKPAPTVLATTKIEIETWMQKTITPADYAEYLKLVGMNPRS
jgi:hypothetical protein